MAHRRYWQARVTYPGGGALTFGVRAATQARAVARAGEIAAIPGPPGLVTVTRLYGRYHPLHARNHEEAPWTRDAASPSRIPGAAAGAAAGRLPGAPAARS